MGQAGSSRDMCVRDVARHVLEVYAGPQVTRQRAAETLDQEEIVMADGITKEDVVSKLRDASWVMMTTAGADGKLVSHPMVPQQVTDDADVWFFVSLTGGHSEALQASPEVNLSVAEAGAWLSVAADVEFIENRAKIDELWNKDVEGWFEGKDDPAIGLIKANSESAQFWGLPGGKMSALARIVKSRVSGDRTDGGSETMEL